MSALMETDSIMKSLSDKRQYRKVVLKNSLEVLLISDSETDKCAASMDVGVGSFSDPVGIEGLAHFLEHMLFYASEKYPLEGSYSKYISEHGGSTNAFTASMHTNYYFDVNTDSFEEALDRFAQFFIKPLMSLDATTREIKAVDSENQKNLLSDGWKMYQLQKHFSDVNHPYHKFGTGNWETLEVIPKGKGINTHAELLEFYKQKYSANIMHLVIYSKEPLDAIQLLAEEKFQDIPNYDKEMSCFPRQPCNIDHLQLLVKAIPIQEGHTLIVQWPTTPNILHYKEAPCRYLGHLIGHEGEGSLYYVLKIMGWATSLSAGEGDWTRDYSFFTVTIDLTDSGQEHVLEVVGLLFRYLELLKQSGVCKWIFDELASVCDTSFHYQDKGCPIDYVVQISTNMQYYPIGDWLVGSSLPSIFSPTAIQTVLDQLSSENIRIFWHSKKFEGKTDLIEPWYGTPYSAEKLTSHIIQEWVLSAPNENLHLPIPNMFIPTNLSVINSMTRQTHLPVMLRNSPLSSLWYKPDTMFSMPKAYVKIDFTCPIAHISPESGVLTNIFVRMLMDYLNEYAYYAQVAELSCSVSVSDRGFEVAITGYNHKLSILLEKIIEEISQFSVKEDRFHVMKEKTKKDLKNIKFQQPYHQAMYYSSLILEDQSFHWTESYEALLPLKPEDLTKFSSALLSSVFLECYIAGNIEQTEAISIVEHVENVLFKGPSPVSHPLSPSQHFTKRILNLPKGSHNFYQNQVLNPSDENSALVHYIQVGPDDFLMNVKLQLFILIAKQPAFHQLRTVEQLGYITFLMKRNDSGIRGVQFIIQSTVKGPAGIDQRAHEFLKSFEEKLLCLSPAEFQNNVDTLIEMKLEKHKNLSEETKFYWSEVANGTLKFDRVEREVAALKQISHADLMEFFNDNIKVGSCGKKSLSVRIYGSLHSAEFKSENCGDKKLQPNSSQIEDIFCFRRSLPLYGSFAGRRVHGKL